MATTTHLSCRMDTTQDPLVIVVSKRVAPLAVHRNKLKRRIREVIRVCYPHVHSGFLYTKKGASELTFNELRQELQKLLGECK